MSYYDRIAGKWHEITGYHGGAFKEFVLNDYLACIIGGVVGNAILELGAGNGYFMRMLLRRFSGQSPGRVVVSDQSAALIDIARRHCRVPKAEYIRLDVRAPFPFDNESFDLVLATMLFNELSAGGVRRALAETRRVLSQDGRFIMCVTHPDFLRSLSRRRLLRSSRGGTLTMPGASGLKLPVVNRSKNEYDSLLRSAGFTFESEDVFPNAHVLSAKPGLKNAGNVPLALVFTCARRKD